MAKAAPKWRDALDDAMPHLNALQASRCVRYRLRALFAVVTHPDLTEVGRAIVRDACRELAAALRESGPVDIGGVVYRVGPDGGLECSLPWGD